MLNTVPQIRSCSHIRAGFNVRILPRSTEKHNCIRGMQRHANPLPSHPNYRFTILILKSGFTGAIPAISVSPILLLCGWLCISDFLELNIVVRAPTSYDVIAAALGYQGSLVSSQLLAVS